jgi:hypothetical protein
MAKKGKSNNNRLQVCRVIDVPLHEVSGICLRHGNSQGGVSPKSHYRAEKGLVGSIF